jgi:murein L,D-transpeptidase YcbB/YkuD
MVLSRFAVMGVLLGLLAVPAGVRAQAPASSPPAEDAKASADPTGFQAEFAQRLAEGAGLTAADREDRAALAKFYAGRQQDPLWVTATGLTPEAEAAMAEIRRAADWGLDPAAFRLPSIPEAGGRELFRSARADAEIALSLAILKYARHAHGGRAEPLALSRNLDRKLSLLDPLQVIEEAAKAQSPDAYLKSLHPKHPQFEALRQKYLSLRQTQPDPQSEATSDEGGKRTGDKKTPRRKSSAPATAAASMRTVLANMEEWRWMPDQLGDFYVWVNVPEFTLRVVKDGNIIHSERVIVGKADTSTPILSQDLEQVIFHPSWGVPESIKRADILPSLARGNMRFLSRYNLRIQRGGRDVDPESVDWASADMRQFHVYQPPGKENVLGVVKFRFPNKHDVYMHDTPTKNLFEASVRTFSHGCMRVRDPQKLAELVLADEPGWSAGRVAAAINGSQQNNAVSLTRKVPVHITYFTAMIDRGGELKTFADIYGHEERIALGMEGKMHLIKKDEGPPRPADVVGHLVETTNGGAKARFKKEWAHRAFEGGFGNN